MTALHPHLAEELAYRDGPRPWDADPDVCCAAFQLGACVHTETLTEDEIADLIVDSAEFDGRAAFARGERRVCPIAPASGRVVGADDGWVEQVRAWYRGWDDANLAAPVELVDEPF